MSLPPHTIRIKRPRDEAPVQALYIDGSDTKRVKTNSNFIFRLAHTVPSPTSSARSPATASTGNVPALKSSRPGSSASVERPKSPGGAAIPITPLAPRQPGSLNHEKASPATGKEKISVKTEIRRVAEQSIPLSAIDSKSPKLPLTGVVTSDLKNEPGSPATPATPVLRKPGEKVPARQGTFGDLRAYSGALTPKGQVPVRSGSGVETPPLYSPAVSSPLVSGNTSDGGSAEKRKVPPAAVRRYHLAKRLRVKHPHPYAPGGGGRSAIFMREKTPVGDEEEDEELHDEIQAEPIKEVKMERKRPKTHPKEKERLEQIKKETLAEMSTEEMEEADKKKKELDEFGMNEDSLLARQLQSMVLDYLNSGDNQGMKDIASITPAAQPNKPIQKMDKNGGGVGGGTWKTAEKKKGEDAMDTDEMDTDEEEGYVYDVYIREVAPSGEKREGNFGVLVIEGVDNEQWWYEGDDDIESDGDVWGSDDVDSNAEDYHTNDYPDEPVSDDAEDEYGIEFNPRSRHQFGLDDDDEEEENDDDDSDGGKGFWTRTRSGYDEEEFDLDEYDDEEEIRKMNAKHSIRQTLLGYRENLGARHHEVDSDGEMEF
ncbi:hypothetical protein RUND412_006476 [Rhizina undulata]